MCQHSGLQSYPSFDVVAHSCRYVIVPEGACICEHVLAIPKFAYVGAVPGSQALNIAWSMQVCVEKGLDDQSRFGCAQMDIKQYYDSLPVFAIVKWLQARGCQIT